jgi:hypothetical protein
VFPPIRYYAPRYGPIPLSSLLAMDLWISINGFLSFYFLPLFHFPDSITNFFLSPYSILTIEIGLEKAPFFSSFEHVKSLLIMGPNNTKNPSLK